MDNISQKLKTMEYAVRGLVPTRAEQIAAELESQDHKYPFAEVIRMNIGNPHIVGQKPIQYYRCVCV